MAVPDIARFECASSEGHQSLDLWLCGSWRVITDDKCGCRRVVELLMQMSSDQITIAFGGELGPGLIRPYTGDNHLRVACRCGSERSPEPADPDARGQRGPQPAPADARGHRCSRSLDGALSTVMSSRSRVIAAPRSPGAIEVDRALDRCASAPSRSAPRASARSPFWVLPFPKNQEWGIRSGVRTGRRVRGR
jgi:hypothetical protein